LSTASLICPSLTDSGLIDATLIERRKMRSSVEAPDWSTIPAPADDGAARHLPDTRMPSLALPATNGTSIDLSRLAGRTIVYAYPRTGKPGVENPDGWDMIPGARGCTPQSCAFRDHFATLKAFGVRQLFGLSTQDTGYQREAAERLHLPFPLLSDARLQLTKTLDLPTFTTGGLTLLKRFTLVIDDGTIRHVFYPVFPPDQNAGDVLAWLSQDHRATT
jgi:peroxiredoxin